MRLGGEAEQRPVAVKAPRWTRLDDLKCGLSVAVEELMTQPTAGVLVGQLDDRVTMPLDVDDAHRTIGQDAPHPGSPRQLFESRHPSPPVRHKAARMRRPGNPLIAGRREPVSYGAGERGIQCSNGYLGRR